MANKKATYQVEVKANPAQAAAEAKRLAAIFRNELSKVSVGTTQKNGGGSSATASQTKAAAQAAAVSTKAAAQAAAITTQAAAKAAAIASTAAAQAGAATTKAAAQAAATTAKAAAQQQAAAIKAAAVAARPPSATGTGGLGSTLLKGAAAYVSIQAARQIAQTAFALDDLRTKSLRAESGFKILSGSAAQAGANIRSIQNASNGTIDRLTAMQVGNQALALGLAKTSDQFGELTRAARAVSLISPVIHDVQGAISELGLASANLSWRRLDQLGLSVSEVRDRFKELQKANPQMDDSAAFLAASVEILNTKYGELLDTQEANASGAERLRVQYEDLKVAMATGPVGNAVDEFFQKIADSIQQVKVLIGGGTGEEIGSSFDAMIAKRKADIGQSGLLGGLFGDDENQKLADQIELIDRADKAIAHLQAAVDAGVPGADALLGQASVSAGDIAREDALSLGTRIDKDAALNILKLDEALNHLSATTSQYGDATADAFATDKAMAEALAQEQIAVEELAQTYIDKGGDIAKFAEGLVLSGANMKDFTERIAGMEEFFNKRQGVRDNVVSAGAELVKQFGIDEANKIIEQKLQETEILFQRFQRAGIRGGPMLDLGIADFTNQFKEQIDGILAEADRLQELANLDGITSQLNQSLANLNSGAFDGVEGIAAIRDELLGMASDVMFTAGATDEQAARFAYLSAVAYAAADSTSAFGQTQAALGVEFLNTNDYVGALASEMANLDGAYATGAISADYHRAALIQLVSAIYAAAQAAGAAAPQLASLLALKNALLASGPVNTPDAVRGTNAGRSIQQREALKAGMERREQLRDQQAQAAKEAAKGFKSAAGSAAKDFNAAAKSTKQAFENAAKTLESALRKVPGLFGASEVTQQQLDLAKAGGSVNMADDYLRRLRDEVKNGKDWADVSIEGAKTALERIGIAAGGSQEEILAQFEEAWSNSSLFADKANLDLINQDAVRQQLQIQDKIKQGQQNILDLFGATVDGVMAGVKAGDATSLGLVAGELEGSDDKAIQEMAKGLRDKNQAMIDKVLALAVADPVESGGGGGGGASAGGLDIPDAPIFDPAEFYDSAIAPFVDAGAQLSSPEFFAGFDAFGKKVNDWQASVGAAMPMSTGAFGPAALPPLAAAGSLGAVAGPALTVDPASATDYMATLAAEFAKSENTTILADAGKGMGQVLGVSMAQADNSIQATGYVLNLAAEFMKSTNTDMLATVGRGMAQVLGVSMAQADNATQATGYVQALQTAFYAPTNLEIARRIGVGIQATIAGGIIDNSTGTNAAAASMYMANLATGFSGPDVGAIPIAIGDTLAFLVDAGFNEHVGADKSAKFLTDTATQFGTITDNLIAVGDTSAYWVGAGFTDHDFSGLADGMIADLKAAFGSDATVASLTTLGGSLVSPIFQGFKNSVAFNPWLQTIVDEVVSQALDAQATATADAQNATVVTGAGVQR